MTLPLLISVPHAGLRVPDEAQPYCALTQQEIAEDGDEGAAEIYDMADYVGGFVTTDVARAIIDLNRAEDDRRKDGIVKTHTCWDVPVYSTFPPEDIVEKLLATWYRPYHKRLTRLAEGSLRLGVDCHTMASTGPPVAPDPGEERPWVCLSNGGGTCPDSWMDALRVCFERSFGPHVTVNHPFKGGYITRSHATEMPWVQLELSRASFDSNAKKRDRVLQALRDWTEEMSG